jgi:hypothetical protein
MGAAGVILSAALWAPEASAQERPRAIPDAVHGLQSRPTTLSPTSGPPGTVVTVRGSFLPAITPVQVALGGTQSGFEALRLVLTNRAGEMEEVVEIPDWAKRDRAHRFIIFDAYFSPLSASPLFHVTDENGLVVRQGKIEEVRGGCVVLRGDDEELYFLMGARPGLAEGDDVSVEGRFTSPGPCGEGLALQVIQLNQGG